MRSINTDSAVPTLGASGAVAAVLGGYLLLFPRARVVTFVFIIFFFTILELPAILFLGIWILQQALFAYFDLLQPTGEGERILSEEAADTTVASGIRFSRYTTGPPLSFS